MKRNRLYLALPIIILLLSILILLGKNYYWFVRGEQIYTKIYANHPDFACSEESESDLSVRVDMMTAVDFYKAALRGPFPTWRAWYRSGQAYCRLGEYELAQSAFESFLAQNPSALGQIELGFVNVHLQNMAQAVKYWKQGFLSEEDFLQAARNNFDLKEYLQSAKWYLRASYFGRDYASSIAYLTYLDRSAQGESHADFTEVEEAIRIDSGWDDQSYRVDAFLRLGKKYLEDGEFEKVIRIIEQIIPGLELFEIDSYRKSEIYRLLGLAQWNLYQLSKSLANLETAVLIDPDNPYAQIHYGKVLFELDHGSIEKTQESFVHALYLLEFNSDIFTNLYDFWLDSSKPEIAQKLCQESWKFFGNDNPLRQCMTANK